MLSREWTFQSQMKIVFQKSTDRKERESPWTHVVIVGLWLSTFHADFSKTFYQCEYHSRNTKSLFFTFFSLSNFWDWNKQCSAGLSFMNHLWSTFRIKRKKIFHWFCRYHIGYIKWNVCNCTWKSSQIKHVNYIFILHL